MRLSRVFGVLTAPLIAGALLALTVVPARADSDESVARLSWLQGDISVQHSDGGQNVAGAVNAPLVAGDAMTTGSSARAEVQFDGTSALRMGANTQVRFAQLDPSNRNIQLAEGTINLDLFHSANTQPVIDTPSVSVRAISDGRYRVTVTNEGVSYITVRDGAADVLLPQGHQVLRPGSTMVVSGRASHPSYSFASEVGLDEWDQFNQDRDGALDQAVGYDGISSSVAVGDLNNYGNWVNDPSYGNVWVPYQNSGWAPYQDGSWTWIAGYGWSWVGSEPWGWAPYHYGRWFYDAGYGGWAWWPGSVWAWSPALVGFFGFGSGFGFGFSFGNVGWCALAPWEPLYPWWGGGGYGFGYSPTFINITNIYNFYGNASHGGMIGISSRRFIQGDFRGNTFRVQPGQLARVGGIRGSLPFKPSPANMRFTQDRALPGNLADRRFAQNVAYAPRFSAPARPSAPTVPAAQLHGFGTRPSYLTPGRQTAEQPHAAAVRDTTQPETRVAPQTRVETAQTRDATAQTHDATAQTHDFAQPVARPNASTGDAWSRFNDSRGTTTTYVRPSSSVPVNDGARDTTNVRPSSSVPVNDGSRDATYSAPRAQTYGAPRAQTEPATTGAWQRFASQRGGYTAPAQTNYRESPQGSNGSSQPGSYPQQSSQPRSYPQQYSQPRSYPQQSSQPRSYPQQYSAPSGYPQQYSAPRSYPQQYSAPRSYPQQYSAPRSYPQQYSAPRSYSAPSGGYHAAPPPPRSSGGSGGSRSSGGGSNHHPG